MSQAALACSSVTEKFEKEFSTSRKLHEQASELFPHGVTHDLRYLTPFPIYVDRAEGAYKWDVDGHQLIDFWAGHGALLLGHSHPEVVSAVQKQMAKATHPGACHELEVEWGQWVQRLIPSAERMRFVSSGTEATLMALRLCRIATGKPKVLKFAGHFHGWHDFVLPACDLPYRGAQTPGIPRHFEPVIVRPNDPDAVEQALANDPEIGCVIIEPTGGHFGQVPVRGPFLTALREITEKHRRLLIFDEVITGFRVHPNGAQGHYGIKPDLTTMAKILAGGLPGGCVAGRADILDFLTFRPGQPKMKHPGTFNANPLSAAAGTTTLRLVSTGEPCRRANELGQRMRRQLNEWFARRNLNWVAYGEFSGVKLLPNYDGPRPDDDTFIPYDGDPDRLEPEKNVPFIHAFRQALLLNGVDMPGLAGMTMSAHSEEDIDRAVDAIGSAIEMLK
ncbi:MAG: aspartate aminotransferase family protein [Gemmatales bacterium]|nr:MAG: aspartate aminotransferase family protein [Gemmatales bacterium]